MFIVLLRMLPFHLQNQVINVEIRNTKHINWTEQSVYVLEGDKQHTLFISQTYFLMDLKLDPNTNVKSLPL